MDAPPPSPGGASLAMNSTAAAPVSQKTETKAPTEKPSGSGCAEKPSGSGSVPKVPEGCPLPPFANLQWEANAAGGWEAWHAPEGSSAPRKSKTYLGYFGKRKLAEWERLPEAERLSTVAAWTNARRKEKGIG
jgi:hypothetical protein